MNEALYPILATVAVSLVSLVGVVTLMISDKILNKILLLLVALSAGVLMGGAFLHLIPEAFEEYGPGSVSIWILVGFSVFFVLERLLHWHHCHKHGGKCEVHTFTYMNLVGDGLHNFVDGLLIAASFSMDFSLGMATTVAVIAHEIPQEIGDFAVLLHGGFSKGKALLMNFLSALVAVAGAVVGVLLVSEVEDFTKVLIPLTAGGFIYIAASDLIPELHKQPKLSSSILSFAVFILGIVFMFLLV
ncbi:ZIP family metal transporter [Patescibacteria group bacterium]|nr:ZIP family metal transporter [Patescibacteria group bacterium]